MAKEKFINQGSFIKNLPKIYGMYTGGFLIFILLMAVAESAGMTAKTIGIIGYILTLTHDFFPNRC